MFNPQQIWSTTVQLSMLDKFVLDLLQPSALWNGDTFSLKPSAKMLQIWVFVPHLFQGGL